MRKRTKRILAFMLAMVLFATSFVNENLITAFAAPSDQTEYGSVSVQFGSTPVSDINNLEGMVTGHDLDLKLKVVSNDGEQTKNNITLENNSMNNIVYDSAYTYTYMLTSENYDLVLAGGDGTTYSQKATGFTFDENKQFTLVIEKVIPKYTFTMSPETTDPLTPGSSTEFSVNIVPEAWNDQIVTWSVLRNSEYVSITTDNNKCTVTVNDSLGSDDLEITLNAFAPNRQQMSKSIKLGKTPVALSVESQKGNWDAIQITAATNPALSGAELKLVVPSAVEGEQGTVYTATTNEEGKAVFTVALTAAGTLSYHVEYAGNNTYKSAATASRSYTPTKKTPDLKFVPNDNVNIVCGTEVKIGTVSSSVAGDQKQSFSSEAITEGKQNGTVRIDENGYVYYTPSVSGTAAITITRVEDTNYNIGSVSTSVSAAKKTVTIGSVKTEDRAYNGEKDDIKVSVTLANTINSETIKLETNGTVEDENSDEEKKEVTARVTLSDELYKKYEFAGGAKSIEVKTADSKKPTVLIKKAPIKVTVGDNEKEWQADDKVASLNQGKIGFSYDGFCGEDKPVNEEGLKECIKYETSANGIIGEPEKDVIGIELPEGEDGSSYVGSNYYIEKVIKGSLTLLPEKNPTYTDYISIDNDKKLENHVYQPDSDGDKIYYGNDPKAEFKFVTADYRKIWIGTKDVSGGIKLLDNDNKNAKFYLTDEPEVKEDGKNTYKRQTEEFSIYFEEDRTEPEISIEYKKHIINIQNLINKLTFGLFYNESQDKVSIKVSDAQSGIAKWAVYKVTNISDELEWDHIKARIEQAENSNEKLEIIKESFDKIEILKPESSNSYLCEDVVSTDGTYVYYVEATDNVGNSIFVGSNGIIIDGTNLNDIEVVVKEADADDSTAVLFKDEKVKYFNKDVELHVEINDNKENNCIYTGVNAADVSVEVIGGNAISDGMIQMDGRDVNENSFSLISNEAKPKTLEQIHAASVDKRIVVKASEGVSDEYSFTFSAEDFAGNKPSDKKVKFVIDKAFPIIQSIDTEKDGDDVKVSVEIQERYLDKTGILISGTCNGKECKYTLKDIQDEKADTIGLTVEKINEASFEDGSNDEKKVSFTLVFSRENATETKYDLNITVTDKSGNEAKSDIGVFYIDTVAPVIATDMEVSQATEGYYNENVEIPVKITERYLETEEVVIKTRIDDAEKTVDYTLADLLKAGEDTGVLSEKSMLSVKEVGSFEDCNTDPAEKNFTLVYALDKYTENKFEVVIEATDKSANHSEETVIFYIDRNAPEIKKADIKATRAENSLEGYYNSEYVEIDVEITERYLDRKQVIIKTQIDDAEQTVDYTLADLFEESEGTGLKLSETSRVSVTDVSSFEDCNTDPANRKFTLVYLQDNGGENKFDVTIVVKDKAGNEGEDKKVDTFYIDRKAPVQKITFTANPKTGDPAEIVAGSAAGSPLYLNEDYASFDVTLEVVERYFADSEGNVNLNYTVDAQRVEQEADGTEKDPEIAGLAENASKLGENGWTAKGSAESCTYVFAHTQSVDAAYSFTYNLYDNAGNASVWADDCDNPTVSYITLDKTRPEGEVSFTESYLKNFDKENEVNVWQKFVDLITFKLFGKDKIEVKMKSSDVTADVKTIQYYESTYALAYEDISGNEIEWKDYVKPFKIKANGQAVVYERVEDKAGNIEYFSSDGVIVDNTQPKAPIITVKPSAPAWGKGIYSAADNPRFDFEVIEPTAEDGSRSGLKSVTYTITNGTTNEVTTETFTFGKGEYLEKFSQNDVTIDPNKFYSNDVKIQVTAQDWSGNSSKSNVVELAIDSKSPVVKFSFDTSDAQNQKYYKNNKTLTITVNERNFDKSYIPHVTSTTGSGYSWSGWTVSGEIATGTVTFSGDSDYTVTYDCYDLAGNKSNTEHLDEFTVDKTNPVINVSYDNNSAQNGNYYKAARTATITITEHNFRASDVKVTTTASNGAAPIVRGWSSSGDRHTATVYFGSDADYTFDISYIDLAGNSAADYQQDKFTVDLTNPVIEITGVEDKSANKETVAPTIKINDTNFDPNGVTITLVGAKKGTVNVSGLANRMTSGTGQIISFKNFADDMDDLYVLTAKSVDKAGNETTQSIQFSVNRHGSTYTFSKETQDLVDKGYTNEPVDIVVTETNVDTLEFIELSYSKDGQIIKLTEGTDYKVEASGSNVQWKQYKYTIFASCFEEEGKYNINISSVDRAENESNNKVQSASIEFTVDKTAPTMAISNLDNMGRYNAETHEFTLDVKDNTILSKVELYLDGELVHTYEGDELTIENGKLYITVEGKDKFQNVKLIAYDEAGNQTEPVEYSVLVTANGWVQFVANKPAFYGTIAVLVVIAGIIIVVILKKKKNDEEKAA